MGNEQGKGSEPKRNSSFTIGQLEVELLGFLEESETLIGGEEMLKRAKKLGANAGHCHATAMLSYANDEEMLDNPLDKRRGLLVFPEALGGNSVTLLCWGGFHWFLRPSRLDQQRFSRHYKLVRVLPPAQAQTPSVAPT